MKRKSAVSGFSRCIPQQWRTMMRVAMWVMVAAILCAVAGEIANAQTRHCTSTRVGNTTYTNCY
jgi:hypothetical protein